MDTLALLCTLHADGPASMRRLRDAELCSMDEVLGCSVETTADVLGLSMAQARRFQREARMLSMRMGSEGLDREEAMFPGTMTSGVPGTMGSELAGMREMMARAMERTAAGGTATQTPAETTPSTPPEPVMGAAVVTVQGPTFSSPETAAPAAPGAPVASAATAASPQTAVRTHDGAAELRSKPDIAAILAPVLKQWEAADAAEEELACAPMERVGAMDSAEGFDLDGVDERLKMALRAAGYATLSALADAEPLELSRATGRTYSEACRVRFLAQRAIQAGARGAATCVQETETVAAEVVEPAVLEMATAPSTSEMSDPAESTCAEAPAIPGDAPGPSAAAMAETERILRELAGNLEQEPERFSPASPEREYPQDPPLPESNLEEGPGGPFA